MSIKHLGLVFVLAGAMCLSCRGGNKNNNATGPATVHVSVTSVSQPTTTTRELVTPPQFSNPTDFAVSGMNSGPPDYVKITLTSIDLVRGHMAPTDPVYGTVDNLWTGSAELMLNGGPVDVSQINAQAQPVAPGPINQISTTFLVQGLIKGTLTAQFNMNEQNPQSLTVYTKADAAYDAVAQTGGADSYTHFQTGPAEEVAISLYAGGSLTGAVTTDGQHFTISTQAASNQTVAAGDTLTLTLLFDTSRILGFYNGLALAMGQGGPKAYFFAHAYCGAIVAAFFGEPGSFEGYDTFFSLATETGDSQGAQGWMNAVYDSSGNFITGILTGDTSEDPLSVAVGHISSMTRTATDGGAGLYTIDYGYAGSAQSTINNFARVSTLNYYSELATFTTPNNGSGEVYFRLGLKTP